ncbi:MAG: hypothetical protein ACI9SK_002284, partial [Zhongshania sp.]
DKRHPNQALSTLSDQQVIHGHYRSNQAANFI